MELIKCFKLSSEEKTELYKINSSSNDAKNVLIIGTIHGEEPQGYLAINNYFFKNKFFNIKNNIYIIPCLNPDGMKLNRRKNSNGVDLNRNFPAENWELADFNSDYFGGYEPCSEDETKFTVNILSEIKFDLILTLHSPFAIVNYDGPAKEIAKIISEFTNYPVQESIGYPTPGSFGTYCGVERKIPTITLEYDENEDINSIFLKSNMAFEYLMRYF